MRHVTIAALAVAMSACAYQPEVSVTGGARIIDGDESGLVGCLELRQKLNKNLAFKYEHCSDPRYGKPFNDGFDLSHDVLGVQGTWGGNARE